MAHPIEVKAQAMVMLMTGDNVVYVAKQLGVPKQTVSRWKPEADQFFREIVQSSPELRAIAAAIREVLPGLHRPYKNGTKKGFSHAVKKASQSGASVKV
jgi:hypothetical protein